MATANSSTYRFNPSPRFAMPASACCSWNIPVTGALPAAPSEESVTATFLAAYDWASNDSRVDPARIIGYGRSLGGGAVAQLAARRPLAALVLESTFTSIGELVRAKGIPAWLVVNEFDTRAVLAKYPGPVLILHGTQDGTFPVALAHALHKASPRSELHLQDCGHNDCPRSGSCAQFPR
jgi:fermentation-respiration switch protein FrsA (DUF1100 family)